MARIVYGVQGEGHGHSSRSKAAIDHLVERGHDVRLVTNRKSTRYLSQFYPVLDTFGLHFSQRDGEVLYLDTVRSNTVDLARRGRDSVGAVDELIRRFRPHLLITDFEPIVAWAALRHNLPLITLDRQHVLTNCRLDLPGGARAQFWLARAICRGMVPRADASIVSTFHDAPVRPACMKRTFVVGPVLRRETLEVAAGDAGHLLAYTNSEATSRRLAPLLGRIERPIVAYGFGREGVDGHITFRAPSTRGFLEDLATAHAVVAGAGNVLAGEALHFGKPCYAIPLGNQVEQLLVAHYIELEGFGVLAREPTVAGINDFLARRDRIAANIARVRERFHDNERAFSTLGRLVSRYAG